MGDRCHRRHCWTRRPGTYSAGLVAELADGRRGVANTDYDVAVVSNVPGDLNNDYRVDMQDFMLFQTFFTGRNLGEPSSTSGRSTKIINNSTYTGV